ncbi:hypothetical protein [Methylobacterium haplocladii]|uniref:Uncharacterized protein n=1 Tax=Methylobacterium haplocladii TaxID=1176176 RepID=A0A512IT59_9HYPH|nr:hypothetical protein [Methylobacterium haplocladii]GEP00877.1 hypothetical protein MHA02_32640 [Methylobacterium haplocladii]GJD86142.1 hypothetical protein HPGCJGGD_4039 [Methylobacterium haplocladii]GLS60801.1 hypothetical protein GCM10007887_34890 [Methylobacterium haplocladii]
MSRFSSLALAGFTAAGLTAATLPTAQAAPFPAITATQVGGTNATVDHVGWRRGYYGGYYGPRYGYGYGYRRNVGGALAAGAALGLIGTAIAASAAPRYGYDDYGYARPVYGYPAYGYGGYGYPYGW